VRRTSGIQNTAILARAAPGYFAHQKVIAEAVESNLTSVRKALFELRDAGFVAWDLIPPHHPLPTGKYTRTNVNQYFVQVDALLRALGGDEAVGPPKTVAPTHPNSSASTGTILNLNKIPPYPPRGRSKPPPDRHPGKGRLNFQDSTNRDQQWGNRTPRPVHGAAIRATRECCHRSWKRY
jgi:hypothetical protein